MRKLFVVWKKDNDLSMYLVLANSAEDAVIRIRMGLGIGTSVAIHAELCSHGQYILAATFIDK